MIPTPTPDLTANGVYTSVIQNVTNEAYDALLAMLPLWLVLATLPIFFRLVVAFLRSPSAPPPATTDETPPLTREQQIQLADEIEARAQAQWMSKLSTRPMPTTRRWWHL